MSQKFRSRHPDRHRIFGRLYAGFVLIAAVSGLVIAFNAEGGLTARLGFGILAVLWLATTLIAVVHARARRLRLHRDWMIRSAALTFAGVTLRLWLTAGTIAGLPFETVVYPMAAWLCWVINLGVAEGTIRRAAVPAPKPRQRLDSTV